MRRYKCQTCKEGTAEWAMQFIGEEKPTFTTLGSHYRGFPVLKVCEECRERFKAQYERDGEITLAHDR